MISKVNNTFIYNAENRFITLSMLNVLEYSGIYYMTSGSLWNYYYRDEFNNHANEINPAHNYRLNKSKTTLSKFFEYKTKTTENPPAVGNVIDTENVVSLKYLSNVQRSTDFSLIYCKIELHLLYWEDCVICKISRTPEIPDNPPTNPPTNRLPPSQTTGATYQINSAKLYVPVVILFVNDNIKFKKKT